MKPKTSLDSYISYKNLISFVDIREGDIVTVTSDILRLICVCRENKEKFNPDIFIDSIIEKIGPEGTLLFPTYNHGFCRGKTFDYCKTPSCTGGLSNTALQRKDFKRTRHPIYSFMVWGKDREYLCNLQNSDSWGADSPFEYLYKRNAKNLFVGIDYKLALTFVHFAEEKVGVEYRYFKDFTASYRDENGREISATYNMYVRNPELCSATLIDPSMDAVLIKAGLYKENRLNGIYFGVVQLHGLGNIMIMDIRSKGGLIYPKRPA